jgi:TatD DNase family protein
MLVDTHTHIQDENFNLDIRGVLENSARNDVRKIILMSENLPSARAAVKFVDDYDAKFGMKIRAGVGVHPHEAAEFSETTRAELEKLIRENRNCHSGLDPESRNQNIDSPTKSANDKCSVIAIGEIGLDYFYEFSPRTKQIPALESQIDLALKYNLPISFHVRDGAKEQISTWADFWPIIDNFRGVLAQKSQKIRGVLHSYTEQDCAILATALQHDFYFGVNGIATFAKPAEQDLWRE